MKGVRFYKDLNGCPCPREGKSYATEFNGMAIFHECRVWTQWNHFDNWHCVCSGPLKGSGDGPYIPNIVTGQYKRAELVRISEAEARKLFPALVAYIEKLLEENECR